MVKALCMNDRLISLQGLYGDGKVTIAKSCLRIVADRKIFPAGVMYLNLQGVASFPKFLIKLKQLVVRKLVWTESIAR